MKSFPSVLTLEDVADLLHHHLLRQRLAHPHHGIEAAVDRQCRNKPNHRLFRMRERVNQLGDVVLDEPLAPRVKKPMVSSLSVELAPTIPK